MKVRNYTPLFLYLLTLNNTVIPSSQVYRINLICSPPYSMFFSFAIFLFFLPNVSHFLSSFLLFVHKVPFFCTMNVIFVLQNSSCSSFINDHLPSQNTKMSIFRHFSCLSITFLLVVFLQSCTQRIQGEREDYGRTLFSRNGIKCLKISKL